MKKTFKLISIISILSLFLIYFTIGNIKIKQRREKIMCNKLEVTVLDSSLYNFITKSDIIKYIDEKYDKYKSLNIDSIDLKKIEDLINKKGGVKNSEVYTTLDGSLHIKVQQRKPILRFINKGEDLYASSDNTLFLSKKTFTSHILVVTGKNPSNTSNPREKKWLSDIIELANFINSNKIWKQNIVQISAEENGNITIIPRKGKEKFIFGYPNNIKEKFELMELYYTSIIPEKGEGAYSSVNVKYNNQIICKK